MSWLEHKIVPGSFPTESYIIVISRKHTNLLGWLMCISNTFLTSRSVAMSYTCLDLRHFSYFHTLGYDQTIQNVNRRNKTDKKFRLIYVGLKTHENRSLTTKSLVLNYWIKESDYSFTENGHNLGIGKSRFYVNKLLLPHYLTNESNCPFVTSRASKSSIFTIEH